MIPTAILTSLRPSTVLGPSHKTVVQPNRVLRSMGLAVLVLTFMVGSGGCSREPETVALIEVASPGDANSVFVCLNREGISPITIQTEVEGRKRVWVVRVRGEDEVRARRYLEKYKLAAKEPGDSAAAGALGLLSPSPERALFVNQSIEKDLAATLCMMTDVRYAAVHIVRPAQATNPSKPSPTKPTASVLLGILAPPGYASAGRAGPQSATDGGDEGSSSAQSSVPPEAHDPLRMPESPSSPSRSATPDAPDWCPPDQRTIQTVVANSVEGLAEEDVVVAFVFLSPDEVEVVESNEPTPVEPPGEGKFLARMGISGDTRNHLLIAGIAVLGIATLALMALLWRSSLRMRRMNPQRVAA